MGAECSQADKDLPRSNTADDPVPFQDTRNGGNILNVLFENVLGGVPLTYTGESAAERRSLAEGGFPYYANYNGWENPNTKRFTEESVLDPALPKQARHHGEYDWCQRRRHPACDRSDRHDRDAL